MGVFIRPWDFPATHSSLENKPTGEFYKLSHLPGDLIQRRALSGFFSLPHSVLGEALASKDKVTPEPGDHLESVMS